ncbi:DEAD/DEAH box helicase [Candidatus Woesebacteria bacterium]|nr:DEAD/DEAH box helicase [Candidatus Woesebacteria bacterium]
MGAPIHHDRYINRAENGEATIVEEHPITHQFNDFAIADTIKSAIAARGYTTPTPIQDQVIEHVLQGRDVVGVANTGTGKTAAFLIPLIHKVLQDKKQKVLIMAPTRELAAQIHEELRLFTKGMPILSVLIIGGANMSNQLWALRQQPNFLISTPGRLKDFANRRSVHLAEFTTVVLDEVDRMLDIGFIADIRHLLSLLPKNRQSLFFSATVSPAISSIIASFMTDPITISVKVKETAKGIDQDVIRFGSKEDKMKKLYELLRMDEYNKVLIFGRTKWNVERLAHSLSDDGFSVGSIHGNKSQNQRQRVLMDFKKDRLQILVATDVASRGLDIDDVALVINFDEPASYDDYVHRIGRTGRASKQGKALTFVM